MITKKRRWWIAGAALIVVGAWFAYDGLTVLSGSRRMRETVGLPLLLAAVGVGCLARTNRRHALACALLLALGLGYIVLT